MQGITVPTSGCWEAKSYFTRKCVNQSIWPHGLSGLQATRRNAMQSSLAPHWVRELLSDNGRKTGRGPGRKDHTCTIKTHINSTCFMRAAAYNDAWLLFFFILVSITHGGAKLYNLFILHLFNYKKTILARLFSGLHRFVNISVWYCDLHSFQSFKVRQYLRVRVCKGYKTGGGGGGAANCCHVPPWRKISLRDGFFLGRISQCK